jgi:hypothetical protein
VREGQAAAISFEARVTVPGSVLTRELQGEMVVLDMQSERYYGLDETGTEMWKALTTSPTIQSAFETLLGDYDVDADTLRADLERLVGELSSHGLLELVDG